MTRRDQARFLSSKHAHKTSDQIFLYLDIENPLGGFLISTSKSTWRRYRVDRLEAKEDWRVFHLILNTSALFSISGVSIEIKYLFFLLMTHTKPQLLTLRNHLLTVHVIQSIFCIQLILDLPCTVPSLKSNPVLRSSQRRPEFLVPGNQETTRPPGDSGKRKEITRKLP